MELIEQKLQSSLNNLVEKKWHDFELMVNVMLVTKYKYQNRQGLTNCQFDLNYNNESLNIISCDKIIDNIQAFLLTMI